jgi:beta-galactosidase
VRTCDAQGRFVPTADNEITFELTGPGKIIGVGNGDPSSHEPDRLVEKTSTIPLASWRRQRVDSIENRPEVAFDFDDSTWASAGGGRGRGNRGGGDAAPAQTNVYRGVFELSQPDRGARVTFMAPSLGEQQWVYLNGQSIAQNVPRAAAARGISLDSGLLRPGTNVVAIVATPLAGGRGRGQGGGGSAPAVKVITSPAPWKRSLFSGLAQVIVQSTQVPGAITLKAVSPGMASGEVKLESRETVLRAALP